MAKGDLTLGGKMYKWCITALYTWNLHNFIKQCHPNTFNRKIKNKQHLKAFTPSEGQEFGSSLDGQLWFMLSPEVARKPTSKVADPHGWQVDVAAREILQLISACASLQGHLSVFMMQWLAFCRASNAREQRSFMTWPLDTFHHFFTALPVTWVTSDAEWERAQKGVNTRRWESLWGILEFGYHKPQLRNKTADP